MIPPFLLLFLLQFLPHHVRSQDSPPPGYPYTDFNPSIITIIVILIAALILMTFFTIYIRRQAGGSIRTALSIRRTIAAPRGLDSSVVETFPTFVYSTVRGHKIGKGALECAVCLNEYQDDETLRLIPKCDHVFHPECIDAWFENHVTCPVCRAKLVPDSSGELEAGLGLSDDENRASNLVGDETDQDAAGSVSISVVDGSTDPPVTQTETVKRNHSIETTRLFEKFRSHSTGHSLVQPGENLDRFTLRLPADVRKQIVNRAMLKQVGEGSGKKGYRTSGATSGRRKSYKRLESLERVVVRSERWVMSRAPSFLSRALSIRSPRVVSGNGEAATSSSATPKGSKTVDKIPLNNLGPKSC